MSVDEIDFEMDVKESRRGGGGAMVEREPVFRKDIRDFNVETLNKALFPSFEIDLASFTSTYKSVSSMISL